jgi:D-sedoheptulose 7-phosphate isomerase
MPTLDYSLAQAVAAVQQLQLSSSKNFIIETADLLAERLAAGNKVILAGNGGSLCDATHFAEELTGFFRKKRPALPAIALSDGGHLTCVGNDVGFEQVFSRGVEAYGKPGDVFIGLSTSGNSPNIVRAFDTAKNLGLHTIAFLGKGGGALAGSAEKELIITDCSTSDRIQEAHMTAIHLIIEQLEYRLFPQLCCEEATAEV